MRRLISITIVALAVLAMCQNVLADGLSYQTDISVEVVNNVIWIVDQTGDGFEDNLWVTIVVRSNMLDNPRLRNVNTIRGLPDTQGVIDVLLFCDDYYDWDAIRSGAPRPARPFRRPVYEGYELPAHGIIEVRAMEIDCGDAFCVPQPDVDGYLFASTTF
jgi:hypothetical protein